MLRFTKTNKDAVMTVADFNRLVFQPALKKIQSEGVDLYNENDEFSEVWDAQAIAEFKDEMMGWKYELLREMMIIIKWYIGREGDFHKLNKFSITCLEKLFEYTCPEELVYMF